MRATLLRRGYGVPSKLSEADKFVLVVLIPFLRKLITDKAETPLVEAATVVPVA